MATTSTSDSTPWTTRRVRDRRPAADSSRSVVTAARPWPGAASSPCLAGSSRLIGIELQPSVRALAERLLERLAAGEPQHLWGLGGELPVGVAGQVQAAGDTAAREPVIPGGGELAGGRLEIGRASCRERV